MLGYVLIFRRALHLIIAIIKLSSYEHLFIHLIFNAELLAVQEYLYEFMSFFVDRRKGLSCPPFVRTFRPNVRAEAMAPPTLSKQRQRAFACLLEQQSNSLRENNRRDAFILDEGG